MYKKLGIIGCVLSLYSASLLGALPDWIGYITNNGSPNVTTVPLSTNIPGADAVLPSNGQNVAISNDANTAYVMGTIPGATVLTPIDINTNTVGTTVQVINTGGNAVGIVCMSPDGNFAYVLAPDDGNNGSFTQMDITTNPITVVTSIPLPVGGGSIGMAVTPDGTRAYVCNRNVSELTPIDLTASPIVALPAIPLTFGAQSIAITPDGSTAYLVNQAGNSVVPFPLPAGPEGTPIPVGSTPIPIVITPDGTKAYVSNAGASSVSPIDLVTNTAGAEISIGAGGIVLGLAISPDGAKLYIPVITAGVTRILDIATDTLDPDTIPGSTPLHMGITPDQAPVAAFTMTSNGVFNASASSSLVGSIATYAWDFGDGTTLVTTSPIANHNYAAPGNYNVTLQVTNTAGTSTEYVYSSRLAYRNGGPSAEITQQVTITPSGPVAPTAPTNFRGKVIKNRFATQTDVIDNLKWSASSDPSVTGYRLFRDGVLIATIPATGPFKYNDHNRRPGVTYTYQLVAFNAGNQESAPVVVVLTPS